MVCAEFPRRSQAAYQVAAELCLLSQDIILKPVPVDVVSTLEVNHIKSMCCAIVSCDCVYLFAICYLLHELCLIVNECIYAIL